MIKKWMVLFLILKINFAFTSESIGYYSKGKLRNSELGNSETLPVKKLFLKRNRLYTSQDMMDALQLTGNFIKDQWPQVSVLQVGDLSAENGGVVNGHNSHQNGLDADLVYIRKNSFIQNENDNSWAEEFVVNGKVTKNFDLEKNFELFMFLNKNIDVSRIFVDLQIKKQICQFAKKNKLEGNVNVIKTLRSLRPINNHKTHFHLRLNCPIDDKKCIEQEKIPEGTGCSPAYLKEDFAHFSC